MVFLLPGLLFVPSLSYSLGTNRHSSDKTLRHLLSEALLGHHTWNASITYVPWLLMAAGYALIEKWKEESWCSDLGPGWGRGFLESSNTHGILAPDETPRGYLSYFELPASCPFLRVLPSLKPSGKGIPPPSADCHPMLMNPYGWKTYFNLKSIPHVSWSPCCLTGASTAEGTEGRDHTFVFPAGSHPFHLLFLLWPLSGSRYCSVALRQVVWWRWAAGWVWIEHSPLVGTFSPSTVISY